MFQDITQFSRKLGILIENAEHMIDAEINVAAATKIKTLLEMALKISLGENAEQKLLSKESLEEKYKAAQSRLTNIKAKLDEYEDHSLDGIEEKRHD